MDKIIGDALQHYYKVLSIFGYKRRSDITKILFFDAIYNLFVSEKALFSNHVTDDDRKSIQNVLNDKFECTCEFPKPPERTYYGKLAKAEIPEFTVTFYDEDGTVLKTVKVKYGNSANPPAVSSKDPSKIFSHWSNSDYLKVKKDISVYAVYEDIKFSVFLYNPISGYPVYSNQNIAYGSNIKEELDYVARNTEMPGYHLGDPLYNITAGTSVTNVVDNVTAIINAVEDRYTCTIYTDSTMTVAAFTITNISNGTNIKSVVEKRYSEYSSSHAVPSIVFNGYDIVSGDLTNVTEPVVGYIESSIKTFNVKFFNGNLLLKNQVVEYGYDATAPEAPTKAHYTFDGWDRQFTNVTSDITVKAMWEQVANLVHFKVTYYSYDESGNRSEEVVSLEDKVVGYGSNVTPPEVHVLDSQKFLGWNESLANITEEKTITGTVDVKKFTVEYYCTTDATNSNYKLVDTVKNVVYGTNYSSLSKGKPSIFVNVPGAKAKGWSTEPNSYVPLENSSKTVAGDIKLYYQAGVQDYTIIWQWFEPNSSTANVVARETVNYGANANNFDIQHNKEVLTAISNNNCNLDGSRSVSGSLTNVNSNVTISYKTKSIPSNTIVFYNSDRSVIKSITATVGTKVSAPSIPALDGYEKATYYYNSDQTKKVNAGASFTVEESTPTSWVAYSTPIMYTVTFRMRLSDTGTINNLGTKKVGYNQSVEGVTFPSVTGYIFGDWVSVSGSKSMSNITSDSVFEKVGIKQVLKSTAAEKVKWKFTDPIMNITQYVEADKGVAPVPPNPKNRAPWYKSGSQVQAFKLNGYNYVMKGSTQKGDIGDRFDLDYAIKASEFSQKYNFQINSYTMIFSQNKDYNWKTAVATTPFVNGMYKQTLHYQAIEVSTNGKYRIPTCDELKAASSKFACSGYAFNEVGMLKMYFFTPGSNKAGNITDASYTMKYANEADVRIYGCGHADDSGFASTNETHASSMYMSSHEVYIRCSDGYCSFKPDVNSASKLVCTVHKTSSIPKWLTAVIPFEKK